MKVLGLDPAKRVLWQVVDGPKEWIGTKVSFELKQEGDYTIVLFKHQGWKEPVEFMHHCSTKWGVFLMSLKSLVVEALRVEVGVRRAQERHRQVIVGHGRDVGPHAPAIRSYRTSRTSPRPGPVSARQAERQVGRHRPHAARCAPA